MKMTLVENMEGANLVLSLYQFHWHVSDVFLDRTCSRKYFHGIVPVIFHTDDIHIPWRCKYCKTLTNHYQHTRCFERANNQWKIPKGEQFELSGDFRLVFCLSHIKGSMKTIHNSMSLFRWVFWGFTLHLRSESLVTCLPYWPLSGGCHLIFTAITKEAPLYILFELLFIAENTTQNWKSWVHLSLLLKSCCTLTDFLRRFWMQRPTNRYIFHEKAFK